MAYTRFRADHSSDSPVSPGSSRLGKMCTKCWFRLILAIEEHHPPVFIVACLSMARRCMDDEFVMNGLRLLVPSL